MDCCLCFSAVGSVLPITMAILQVVVMAPEDHHLRPLITYSSPSRRISHSMLVASEEATAGSVMEKHERILPSSRGLSHCSCCSALPLRAMVSMLPVSGALQLNTSGATRERPMISHRCAYSKLVRPAPNSLSGKNRF